MRGRNKIIVLKELFLTERMEKENTRWTPGGMDNQQGKKGVEMERIYKKVFHEATLHINERKASWLKRYKETYQREEDTSGEESKYHNKVDEMNRVGLADSLRQAPRGRSLDHFRTAHGILGGCGEEL